MDMMTMDMGSSTMKMDMGMDMDMGKSKTHMWMYFHTTLADKVLFDFWDITTVGDMILACAIFFCLGIMLEIIKFARFYLEQSHKISNGYLRNLPRTNSYKQRLLSSAHFLQTFLFGIQLSMSYILMLVFMTFSIWLGLAVCLGTAVGYYLFGGREVAQITPNVSSRDPAQH